MQDVIIKYNPYKVISIITVNGEVPKQNSCLVQFLNQRFQLWVDQIPSLLAEEYNDDKFNLTFYGTELDYQDLLAAIKAAEKEDLHFVVKKMDVKEFGDKENDIRGLFERIRKLPFEELQSPAVANAFELAFNELLEVNVVATMSAGKSTLINALLGRKLMPSKQGACTATITKIQDDDDETFKATVLDQNKTEIGHYSALNYKTMMSLNKNPEVSEVQIKGNIPFVTSDEVSLVLIDTPGPDNARDKRHGLVTAKALDQSSKMLVIFVMNGGKLHDEAQDGFLRRIAKSMSVGGKQSKERFMFVINKLDDYDEEDDDIAEETIPDTIKYLEEMGIEDPNIFPAAAMPALLIRKYQNTHDEQKKQKLYNKIKPIAQKMIDQKQLHLEQYPHLVRSCQMKIHEELSEAIENNDIFGQVLIYSGIRGIEETIRMYVTKYCRPAKITNVVNTFRHGLDSAEAFETTRKEIASCQDKQSELGKKIDDLQKKLTSKSENEAFKKKISSLEIATKLTDNVENLISDVQSSLTEFFVYDKAKEQMEEDDARCYIKQFSKLAISKQNEFRVAVNRLLSEDIQEKSQKLLAEYIKKLTALSEKFSIKGLSIDLASFVQCKLAVLNEDSVIDASIESRIEKRIEEKSNTVTKRRRGFDRLLHPSSWVDPRYDITEYYDVEIEEEIKYVSRKKLSSQLIAPIKTTLMNERSSILEFAKDQTENIKEYFYEQFDEVDRILAEKAKELREATISKEASAKALEKANTLLKHLEKVKVELESILEI
ncbi:dynamin family protein [Clostridium tyrobutyricum]|uniref:dynamin family protein n=1 Tax=Clostridium tyrobutyricum TaxID=1519 RepID=UPI001C38F15C|nr:dynamin family protein [Clostridium tyrobutyricum]MBV4428291.1 dynamin family protein [Clostridium tyrobutyricum]MBV4443281.1 dynamin family protein [Clostridium tyrobutyricum]